MTIIELKNSQDAFMPADRKWGNGGSCLTMIVGRNNNGANQRGLIRFPLDSIPPDVITVNSAILSLMCESEDNATDRLVTLYRSKVQWYEGVQCWQAPGEEDGSTWNMRNDNTLDPLHWVGGLGTGGISGDDWHATKTDDELITAPATRFEWDVTADIEDFLDGTYENYGWFVIGVEGTNGTRKWFYANETETEEYRPVLTLDLDYSAGTIPAGVEDCCDGSNYLLMERKGIVP